MKKILYSRIGLIILFSAFVLLIIFGHLEIFSEFHSAHPLVVPASFLVVIVLLLLHILESTVLFLDKINKIQNVSELLYHLSRKKGVGIIPGYIFDKIMNKKFENELRFLVLRGDVDVIFSRPGSIEHEQLMEIKELGKETVLSQIKKTIEMVLAEPDPKVRTLAFVSLMKNEVTQALCVLGRYPRKGVSQEYLDMISAILCRALVNVSKEERNAWIDKACSALDKPDMFLVHNDEGCDFLNHDDALWYKRNRFIPNSKHIGSGIPVFETRAFKRDYRFILTKVEAKSRQSPHLRAVKSA